MLSGLFRRRSSASTKLAAIERVQGWIEFAPSGRVLAVSDTLLRVMGYTRREVVGQHHRVLCDPEYARSAEYAAFWEQLRSGTHHEGVYPRRAKDGREVWLQASYHPVRRFGRVTRIVKFATDVTAQTREAAATAARLAALGASQAMIEFDTDGTIRDANANFLAAMDYPLEAIVGRHHRMFCEAAYAASAEYADFWRRLAAGETFTLTVQRLARGGRPIWIQGSYTPLRDARGRVTGVLKACVDVTAQVLARQELEALAADAGRVLTAMAQGDLTLRAEGRYGGDLGQLAANLNGATDTLASTLKQVDMAAFAVTTAVAQLTAGSTELADRTGTQLASLEETATAVEQLTASVTRNAEHAQAADVLGREARAAAERSGTVMRDALDAMQQIQESGRRIGDITRVIDEIAFQTNILALNAAVEAARAGEHGRGFAVVADEVRSLALRSATAAGEIGTHIEEALTRVSDGNRLVSETATTLAGIVQAVERVTDLVALVRAATEEQAAGIGQVNVSLGAMDSTTQQNAALGEQLSDAGRALAAEAARLRAQVGVFTLSAYRKHPDGGGPRGSRRPRYSQASRPAATVGARG